MLLNEKSGESEQAQYEIDAAFWKSEFECPICFEVRVTTVSLHMVTTAANVVMPLSRRCGRPCGSGSVWTGTRCARAAGTSWTPGEASLCLVTEGWLGH